MRVRTRTLQRPPAPVPLRGTRPLTAPPFQPAPRAIPHPCTQSTSCAAAMRDAAWPRPRRVHPAPTEIATPASHLRPHKPRTSQRSLQLLPQLGRRQRYAVPSPLKCGRGEPLRNAARQPPPLPRGSLAVTANPSARRPPPSSYPPESGRNESRLPCPRHWIVAPALNLPALAAHRIRGQRGPATRHSSTHRPSAHATDHQTWACLLQSRYDKADGDERTATSTPASPRQYEAFHRPLLAADSPILRTNGATSDAAGPHHEQRRGDPPSTREPWA
jgi:hypothetical protein